MRAANFAQTGNIEVVHKGRKVLLGQYAYGLFLLQEETIKEIGSAAYKRIDLCSDIVEEFGKPRPPLIWK